jgi:hypothetical protein
MESNRVYHLGRFNLINLDAFNEYISKGILRKYDIDVKSREAHDERVKKIRENKSLSPAEKAKLYDEELKKYAY